MWQLKQFEKLREIEPDVVDGAIKMLMEKETALKEKLIIDAYMDGDINFSKTAEFLNIHPFKLRERFLSGGIPVKIGISSDEEVQAEFAAAKNMQAKDKRYSWIMSIKTIPIMISRYINCPISNK